MQRRNPIAGKLEGANKGRGETLTLTISSEMENKAIQTRKHCSVVAVINGRLFINGKTDPVWVAVKKQKTRRRVYFAL